MGPVRDILIRESGGREEGHINIKVDLDLTKPLIRGTKLSTKMWKFGSNLGTNNFLSSVVIVEK